MFLLLKEGVYIQEINGVFDSLDIAIAECDKLAETDVDSYHAWIVHKIEKNNVCTISIESKTVLYKRNKEGILK